MKTNQIMSIKVGTFGNVVIGHKDKLVRVNDILAIGNSYRVSNGVKPIKNLQSYFRKPTTWRTIIAIHNKMVERIEKEGKNASSCDNYLKNEGKNPNSHRDYLKNEGKNPSSAMHYLGLKETMDSLPRVKNSDRDKIDYQEILKTKQFDHIIKIQRGGKIENRGYYVNLELMIDIAMMMNEEFKVELIDIFINNKILENRDEGGDLFKELNARIKNMDIPSYIKNPYSDISMIIRDKLAILENRGYNENNHNSDIQIKRKEYIDKLVSVIDMGLITSYEHLKHVAYNL